MIHKEGFTFLIYSFIIILLLIFISFLFFYKKISFIISIFLIILYFFFIFFFRNPKKYFYIKDYPNKEIVISPADGKIIKIQKKIFENEFLKKNCICISIFMSPFNVHVNRFPVSGKVIYTKYHPGKFLIAWLKKSSLNNERTTTVVQINNGKNILFRQIAGFLARRITLYAKKNSIVKKGEEFGFIKFGSRVDLFLPLNSIILVKKGEKVSGGETLISIIPL
ncbi:phosphatidylserine decarboxylase family protein [Blattabacterium cuenoti]|uniref:phosphatidylserine decarboxylase family protein n=1 Tax=Blattabacterium cuenoti TaxID=1653831 RepID=UPI00163BA05E|nr:phosphatidylserine decarboxylase family protein [Blattabacterium cuenoti]